MKFATEHFPLGTYEGQRTEGAFVEDLLAENLDIWALKIAKDMHFLGIISGNDQVGNGKSTLATHIGCYLTYKINQIHGENNTFTSRNMVFSAADLEKRSFELPKYSVIVLDESDDLKEHSMKEISKKLRTYFRKCRQLNQILILITPSFFELNKFYALNRSHALLNVKFMGEYDRGRFDFYGPRKKKLLYLKGKKEWNYDAHKYDFPGHFAGSYFFFPNCKDEDENYRKMKYEDMLNYEKEEALSMTPDEARREGMMEAFYRVYNNLENITIEKLSIIFGISLSTGKRWLSKMRDGVAVKGPNINNKCIVNDDYDDVASSVDEEQNE